jgi:hypothetical protein
VDTQTSTYMTDVEQEDASAVFEDVLETADDEIE